MAQEFYKEEEAEAILRLAVEKSAGGSIPRTRLLATAAELGIPPEAVEEAENALVVQRQELESKLKFERHMKAGFYTHLITYTVVNVFLVLMNFMTGIQDFWAAWCILGWGIAVAIHFGISFFKNTSAYVSEYEKWSAQGGQTDHNRLVIGIALASKRDTDG